VEKEDSCRTPAKEVHHTEPNTKVGGNYLNKPTSRVHQPSILEKIILKTRLFLILQKFNLKFLPHFKLILLLQENRCSQHTIIA
jgi:hypothetical protein